MDLIFHLRALGKAWEGAMCKVMQSAKDPTVSVECV
jgi:hypothetical protein